MQLKKSISYYNDVLKKLEEKNYSLSLCQEINILNENDLVYKLDGYIPKYDVRDDYGLQQSQEIFSIFSNIISELYGNPIETKKFIKDQNMEINYEKWILEDIIIYNYFFINNKTGNNFPYLIFSEEENT